MLPKEKMFNYFPHFSDEFDLVVKLKIEDNLAAILDDVIDPSGVTTHSNYLILKSTPHAFYYMINIFVIL